MLEDTEPAHKVMIGQAAVEDAVGEATMLATLLTEKGLTTYADLLQRWVVAPLAAELTMAEG